MNARDAGGHRKGNPDLTFHITKRLEKKPGLFEQAKANLVDAPEVWNRVAQEENQGNLDLIDKTLRGAVPQAQKAAFEDAGGKAIAALQDFNAFLNACDPERADPLVSEGRCSSFHVHRRVVLVTLNRVELQHAQREVAFHDFKIGRLFGLANSRDGPPATTRGLSTWQL